MQAPWVVALPELNTREALEDEIRKHAGIIIGLKSRINASLAISRLPPELLAYVFLALVVDAYDLSLSFRTQPYNHYSARRRAPAWILVSHVCRQWRHVAFTTPRLWSYIDADRSPRLFPEFLSRSKKAPLHILIRTTLGGPLQTSPTTAIAPHLARIRELNLVGPPEGLHEACKTLVGTASVLEALVLTYDGYSAPVYPPFAFLDAPVLRRLEATNVPFDWRLWTPSPALTKLVVKLNSSSQPPSGTVGNLLDALDQMPHLKTLHLEHAIPGSADAASARVAVDRVCQLNSLNGVRLTAMTSECARFLRHLSFPSSADTFITSYGAQGMADLGRILAERFATSPPPESLVLRASYNGLTLGFPHGSVPQHECIGSALLRCSTQVSVLAVDEEAGAHAILRDVLPTFARVRRLHIESSEGVHWCELLREGRPIRSVQGTAVPLPRLREVFLESAMFEHPEDDERPSMDGLCDWLMERCDFDVPVDTLHVDFAYNFDEWDCRALEELVSDVQWDEHEELVVSEDDEEDEEDEYEDEMMLYGFDGGYLGYDDYDDDDMDDMDFLAFGGAW